MGQESNSRPRFTRHFLHPRGRAQEFRPINFQCHAPGLQRKLRHLRTMALHPDILLHHTPRQRSVVGAQLYLYPSRCGFLHLRGTILERVVPTICEQFPLKKVPLILCPDLPTMGFKSLSFLQIDRMWKLPGSAQRWLVIISSLSIVVTITPGKNKWKSAH